MVVASHAWGQSASAADHWVDSVYRAMSLDEKIGQLFMIRAHSDLGPKHITGVRNQITKFHVGGLCFFQGTPDRQVRLINEYQALSDIPLLVAMDAEWGPGMRFGESALNFPRQLMLGAVQDNHLIYQLGKAVAQQLRAVGAHVNFAPVVDVNNNPLNPVINDRSFGEDKYNVTAKSYQYMKGMQDHGIMACAKHFPGHGDTDVDSHFDLPVISHARQRLDSIELYPFDVLIDKGVQSMMIAHLQVPALDRDPQTPTTLSRPVVTGLLRDSMGFEGIIFTDALEMKGVTKHHEPGQLELQALLAGNDVLTLPLRIDQAVATLREAYDDGRLTEERLAASVKRILHHKHALGLHRKQRVAPNPDLFSPEAIALKSRLIEDALTVVANEDQLLPIQEVHGVEVASLFIGRSGKTRFQERLDAYAGMKHVAVTQDQLLQRGSSLFPALALKERVIVGLAGMNKYAGRDFGLDPRTLEFLNRLNEKTEVILVIFGSPYALTFFEDFDHVMMAYQDDPMIGDIAAQALFGAIPVRGRLPVTASPRFQYNHGIPLKSLNRLGYAVPERVGMSTDTLDKIRLVVDEMISKRAAPGCQILVAKDGKVVYHAAFGHHTYDRKQPVERDHLYDVASVTKVLATTIALMQLHDRGLFDPKQPLGNYLTDLRGSNKAQLIAADVLAHQAGLKSWIPFYEETVSGSRYNPSPSPEFYKPKSDKQYSIPVANNLYLRRTQIDSMRRTLIDSDLRSRRDYRYSDLGFYFMADIVEQQGEMPLDQYCAHHFYQPLGLTRTGFNPLQRFDKHAVVPTEEDKYFRKQRLQGHVHDSGAAMLGGVGGHAGLFGTAGELAVLMQMLMNEGSYGGRQYLAPETVRMFTDRQPRSSRRGLGFDMKELDQHRQTYTSPEASDKTYGHTGFTGTCVWNDPEHHLVFIFLSNRTYPTMTNNKLNKLEIRERIHTLLYHAMRS
ncbi:MAG: glycoside hydrolase family 3 N-terminal domain-containing protein [Saprospiraceae bacterium]|nr:glycoside hydrolase family 3 N-terminal domain-containing protein [Saprospiraceae bacterium]